MQLGIFLAYIFQCILILQAPSKYTRFYKEFIGRFYWKMSHDFKSECFFYKKEKMAADKKQKPIFFNTFILRVELVYIPEMCMDWIQCGTSNADIGTDTKLHIY